MATFKERFNLALELRDISPAELSRRSGVNEGAISQYRSGAYKASQRSLEKLAVALRVSIPWLMGADVPMELVSSDVWSIDTTSDEAKKIAKAFDKAKPKEKDLVRLTLSEYLDDEEQEYQLAAARGLGHVKIPVQDDDDLLPENDTIIDDL